MREERILKFDQNINIVSYRWFNPNANIKGVIQIFHGMAENILRYDEFANTLVDNGFMVIGHDHIAHGKTADSPSEIGKLPDYDFMDAILLGMKFVRNEYKEYFKDTKSCAFAHSMGSMAMQRYMEKYPNDFNYVILSGTDIGGGKYHLLKTLSKMKLKKNQITYSKFILNLTTNSFNKKFKSDHPKYGWLSRNKENIKSYEENEYCGVDFPVNYFYSLSKMMCETVKGKNLTKINPNAHILLYSGKEDPVSNFSHSVKKLAKLYLKHNLNVKYQIIDNARHEVHNENDEIKANLYKMIINFYSN